MALTEEEKQIKEANFSSDKLVEKLGVSRQTTNEFLKKFIEEQGYVVPEEKVLFSCQLEDSLGFIGKCWRLSNGRWYFDSMCISILANAHRSVSAPRKEASAKRKFIEQEQELLDLIRNLNDEQRQELCEYVQEKYYPVKKQKVNLFDLFGDDTRVGNHGLFD